jgi:hypothetical protein
MLGRLDFIKQRSFYRELFCYLCNKINVIKEKKVSLNKHENFYLETEVSLNKQHKNFYLKTKNNEIMFAYIDRAYFELREAGIIYHDEAAINYLTRKMHYVRS